MRLYPMLFAILGCGGVDDSPLSTVERCDEANIADGSAGRAFLLGYCTSCHSSHLVEGTRYSAPVGVDFDTVTGVRANSEGVVARVVDFSMPPSGGLPAQSIDDFVAWIDCGAPSDEEELPYGVWGESGEAFELRVSVEAAQTGLDVVRYIEIGSRGEFPEQPWSVTNVSVSDSEVYLLSEELFREDGSTLWSVHFQNGLAIAKSSEEVMSESVAVTVNEGGVTDLEQWFVVSSLGVGEPIDGQEITQSPTVLSIDVEDGPLWEWHLYEDESPVGYSFSLGTGDGWRTLRVNSEFFSYGGVLPLEEGQSWIERAVVTGGWSP